MNRHADTLRKLLLAKAALGGVVALGAFGAIYVHSRGLTVGEWATSLQRGPVEPRFEWRAVEKRHWQVVAKGGGEPAEVTEAREGNGVGCKTGMARVRGAYRLGAGRRDDTGDVERAQNDACVDWISRDFPARCRTFDKAKLDAALAKLPTAPMDFCIDRFEYPNRLGESPLIVVTFHEADRMCKREGKRLCSEREWTFACEGEEARPYPNGYDRDPEACVVDRPWRQFAEGALVPRDGPRARAELDRLWQAEPSGARPKCKSPFGVYDMTGNVDEWTRTTRTTGYASVLKGGYWGPVRARCRPATRAHNEDFVAYQQGFRCCSDATGGASGGAIPAAPAAPASTTPAAAVPSATVVAPSVPPPPASALPKASAAPIVSGFPSEPDELEVPEDDEEAALTRKGPGLACGVSAPASGGGPLAIGIAALAAAVVRRRRRG